MKTNKKTIHQKVEHFFRSQACLYVVLGLLTVAILKTDSKLVGMMRDAYNQGFGLIGTYMREETTRMPVSFGITQRAPTISGR
ncbi:MAG TPA: hypothetical protein VMY99_05405 [Nevskiaceae bacterium]|nr:hypothetical protein [Nevskiaceae bacterium]